MFYHIVALCLLFLSFCASAQIHSPSDDDDDYKIYDIYANTVLKKEALFNLAANSNLAFLFLPLALNDSARVMVPQLEQASFESNMTKLDIHYTEFSRTAAAINHASEEIALFSAFEMLPPSVAANNSFLRVSEINAYLAQLAQDYPTRVFVSTVGRSYENRDMRAIYITNGLFYRRRKYVLVVAGLHGLEWIAPTAALYIIKQLVENFRENSALLEGYTWIVVPVANPDGYEFSLTVDRMWRKSRRPLGGQCFGVDLNRNFDFHWGEGGGMAEASPCDPLYRGPSAFSEPETRVLRNLMLSLSGQAKFYLSLHSYGRYLLYPWGYSTVPPGTSYYLHRVARAGADAISFATGATYKVGSASTSNVPNMGAGGSDDYAFGQAGIPIAITMQMADTTTGFPVLSQPQQIPQILSETWIGVKAMAQAVIGMMPNVQEEDPLPIWT